MKPPGLIAVISGDVSVSVHFAFPIGGCEPISANGFCFCWLATLNLVGEAPGTFAFRLPLPAASCLSHSPIRWANNSTITILRSIANFLLTKNNLAPFADYGERRVNSDG